MTVNLCVVGAGYWGPNLIRNASACPIINLVGVCDRDESRLNNVLSGYPGVDAITEFDEVLSRSDIDAVVIATPVSTHAPLAIAAFNAGKHVLVEKPLAGSVADAKDMVQAAKNAGRVLMVDHTFIYSPPVRKIKEIVESGELGEIFFIDSVRINLGLFQHDVNVVWDLAPHDLSILDFIVGELPKSLSAFGTSHAGSDAKMEDVAYLNLDFGNRLLAAFHVNWLSPVKVRHFIVGGSKKSIVYNDLDAAEKVKVYDSGITVSSDPEDRRRMQIGYRTGDVSVPHLGGGEPLQTMISHFAECILNGQTPLTDGESGLRVVRMLEAAQHSIKAQGGRITL